VGDDGGEHEPELGHRGLQSLARRTGERAGLARLRWRLRQRPDAQGSRSGRRGRDGRGRLDPARRTGAQPLRDEQRRRQRRAGFLQRREADREGRMSTTRQKLVLPNGSDKLLLHSCCAPCSGELMEAFLESGIDYTIFFYNPNIHPVKEYELRKDENIRFAEKHGVPFVDADYDTDNWFARAKGMENEPERGIR